jgi:hypothetical protein
MSARARPLRCRIGWHRWPRPRNIIFDGDERTCLGCGRRQRASVDSMFNRVFWEDVKGPPDAE